MSHEIEEFADGTAAFVSARQDAWHQLGTVVDHTMAADEVVKAAHLGGWNVRKTPLFTQVDGSDVAVPIPGKFASVRTHPVTKQPDVLGVVGDWYEPIQNEELAALLDTLVDESGAHFETAGSLRNGTEVFVTMKLPQHIEVGGVDRIETYLCALNSHDGSKRAQLLVTPVRIVCANTQAMAIASADASHKITHTISATQRISEAREALGMTFKYLDNFAEQAEKMINTPLREVDFTNKIRRLIPESKRVTSERAHQGYENKIIQLKQLFTGSETATEIRGTRWAGYQAVTEWLDHYSPVRVGDDPMGVEAADARALKTLTKRTTLDLKTRAFAAFAVK
ncbi:MAG TPA: DUF932 domain-containing protein [Pseudonocardiaceae bacterium]|nr:DUF932 domain-containing protein [Pseudonocardiaceae bacterium]